jgi:hypothetical protein
MNLKQEKNQFEKQNPNNEAEAENQLFRNTAEKGKVIEFPKPVGENQQIPNRSQLSKKQVQAAEKEAKASGKLVEMPTGERRQSLLAGMLNGQGDLDGFPLSEGNISEVVDELNEKREDIAA